MRSRVCLSLAGILVGVALLASGCGGDEEAEPAQTDNPKRGGTLRVNLSEDIDFSDPAPRGVLEEDALDGILGAEVEDLPE